MVNCIALIGWIIAPYPAFSFAELNYILKLFSQDCYFAELEFIADVQRNVLDVKNLNTYKMNFNNEEILKTTKLSKLKYNFKEGAQFSYSFKSSFYFSLKIS